ncbi:hypothetical protein [Thalassomonas sp. RHCl1]|uniref:hypothetical protein n=1 Tax=Thalassomonas sp. RHCl1 TaxID=2995320 RepID=UPI00248C32AE|nr:hypothetical protein [Thalassomonas sp. RHCl1]
MLDNLLFFLVFISQILLISYYFPQKVKRRTRFVFDNYPPKSYPKLYPKPLAAYEKGLRNFMAINHLILVLGFVLLAFYAMLSAEHPANKKVAEGLPIFFGLCQFIPFFLMEISGFKQVKLMRAANVSSTRKAELSPRHLFDFVSPALVIATAVIYLAFILVELLLKEFSSGDALVRISATILCNLLLGGILYWNLYGKKLDPYQSYQDRNRQIGFTIRSMFYISIALSLYLMVLKTIAVFHLEYLEVILNSLYFQLIGAFSIFTTLRILDVRDINFDVYKKQDNAN